MTVATTGNKFSYAGDGATVAFSFPRLFFADADLKVILRDAAGVETVQTIVTHYTVTGAENPAGGTVTMVTAPAAGETLVIVRRTVQAQNTDYVTGGAFSADGHEDALDKLTLQVQDLQEQVDRALKLKETTATATPALPEPTSLGLLRWNTAATALENVLVAALGAIGITVTTDNRLMKSQGTAGNLEETGITVDDSNNLSGVNNLTVGGAFTSLGIDDNATAERLQVSDNDARFGNSAAIATYDIAQARSDSILTLTGSTSSGFGGNVRLFGNTHATQANDIELRSSTTVVARWDDSNSRWDFLSQEIVGVTSMLGNNNAGNILFGPDTSPSTGASIVLYGSTHASFASDILLRSGVVTKLHWDDSAARWDFTDNRVRGISVLEFPASGIIENEVDTSLIQISGGTTASVGGNFLLYGGAHATQANDIVFRSGTNAKLHWDDSIGRWNVSQHSVVGVVNLTRAASGGFIGVSGGANEDVGANSVYYGESHATKAHDMEFRSGTALRLVWDDSLTRWDFQGQPLYTVSAILRNVANQSLFIGADTVSTLGANLTMYGSTHASQANDVVLRTGTTTTMQWDDSVSRWTFNLQNVAEINNLNLGGTALAASATNTLHVENGVAPTGSITNGVLLYAEDVAASSELKVRDEIGNITVLSPHNFELYAPDPADPFPWSYRSTNPYLGEEVNVDMSGAIRELEALSGKTFIHRNTIPKEDWSTANAAEAAALDAANLAEAQAAWEAQIAAVCATELEITKAEAVETVALVETVASGNKLIRHQLNPTTGDLESIEIDETIEQPTGETETRLKQDVRLDESAGTFHRCHTRAEAEAIVGAFVPPAAFIPKAPPQWLADREVT